MSHPEVGQGPQGPGAEEASAGAHPKPDRAMCSEMGVQPGNGTQQIMANQGSNTHMMKPGPGPSPMPQHTGTSPQQQLPPQPQQGGPLPGLHFPNVPTTSPSSRPKTPNRASPRPYHHPLTPTNRPPSTEPSEINLSPERLNASIAGLFPPKINIPLPPRQPNLNRGFDQQGLNPTTLKAIGQAPPSLTLPGNSNNGSAGANNTNNSQQSFSAGTGAASAGAKQDKQAGVQGKRASPSNSRRSSPASSRKSATPSPGRQKGTKNSIACPPHQQQQQQLVNPQGPTMMLSPSLVTSGPVSAPSQVSGAVEAQQTPSSFHGIQGNPVEGVRESQGMMTVEQRQVAQPQSQSLREIPAPRMASPRFHPAQHSKPDSEQQADAQATQAASIQDSEVSALRAAPTSLNQLLDNSGIANMPPRPINPVATGKESPKSALETDRPVHSADTPASSSTTAINNEPEAKAKPSVPIPASSPNVQPSLPPSTHASTKANSSPTPSLSQNPHFGVGVNPSVSVNPTATLCNTLNTNTNIGPSQVTSGQSGSAPTVSTSSNSSSALNPSSSSLKSNPSPKPVTSVHSVIQLPASSGTISPNQITVFVTSNPITSATTSQVPTSMVSTMVAVPNKTIRPQDIRQQTPVSRPPQYITTTPVFINSIFQVPGASVAPNTTVVSQPVTVVGPIQVSTTNIQIPPAQSSTQSSGVNVTSTHPARGAVGQVSVSSSGPVGSLPPLQQINPGTLKTEGFGETAQKSSPPVQQPSPHPSPSASSPFQPPMASPPPSSSPGTVNTNWKNPMSPSPTGQMKSKSAQAGTAESQLSPVERPVQGSAGAAAAPAFHPPSSPAVQTESPVPRTTAAPSFTPPTVSALLANSGQVAVPAQIVTALPAPVAIPSSAQTSQPSPVTGTGTTISAPSVLAAIAPLAAPVPSVVPIVAAPGPAQDIASTTSSTVPSRIGVAPTQPELPVMESPLAPHTSPGRQTKLAQRLTSDGLSLSPICF